ncbi:DoxX family protein [Actinosynnema mirum]|uniref:DoxX family protein n=1 Tax=Actinosynnema mirum (strain ATCC 29888 / DSM 43827 / JCM 3225 / NBRC 14064 / NCIMB 13271 / NRRL B-12336 / IMRU 3971 / 101) TaxID=446462 RepID=C6WP90_ACTMD|nr:DoxX family membrane protein [Actinosynnema mirum]ACU38592.1 DoxX family protein [Actinosynnema mirum DSM 43827]
MVPFVVLVVVSLLLLASRRHWSFALRCGLAAMFLVTGISHFVGMRDELIAMVPPALPAPALLVTVSGLLELAGAIGLLWTRTAPWAAAGLGVLLVVMFPANVHAAQQGLSPSFGDQLLPRTLLQAVFLAAAVAVVVHHRRNAYRAVPTG